MKTLKDGTRVSSRTYYYLLDFNDDYENGRVMKELFNKDRLCDLTIDEYKKLFEIASKVDYELF